MSKKLLKANIFLLLVLTISHIVSLNFYLYWQIWWLDILMHFLGGVWVFSFVFWLAYFSGICKKFVGKINPSFFLAFVFTLIVAVGWEFYEFKLGITFVSAGDYWRDTISDIFTSLAGALSTFIFFRRFLNVYAKF